MNAQIEEVEDIAELRRNARRYQQLLDHPRDAHHLFALLLAHTRTNVAGKQYLNQILDQLHIQDLAKAGTLAAAKIWQQGGADGKTGTERAADAILDARMQVGAARVDAGMVNGIADKILADSLAVIDAERQRRAQRAGQLYEGPERRHDGRPFDPLNADLSDMEQRVLAHGDVLPGAPAVPGTGRRA